MRTTGSRPSSPAGRVEDVPQGAGGVLDAGSRSGQVEAVYPPHWLTQSVGRVPSRLLTFAWVALRRRPDYVGGFHLLFNGMAAALLARLVNARSLYYLRRRTDGSAWRGLHSENKLFEQIGAPDARIEGQLVAIIRRFDRIVTMGQGAERTFRDWGVTAAIEVAPWASTARSSVWLIIATSMSTLWPGCRRSSGSICSCSAMRLVAERVPTLRVVVVGDGVSRSSLEAMVAAFGLTNRVEFAGYRSDVSAWLQRAKVFMLTSDGGAVAVVIEAMLSRRRPDRVRGGELPDLLTDGENGFTVASRDAAAFANPAIELSTSLARRFALSRAAVAAAQRCESGTATAYWDEPLSTGQIPAVQLQEKIGAGNAAVPGLAVVNPVVARHWVLKESVHVRHNRVCWPQRRPSASRDVRELVSPRTRRRRLLHRARYRPLDAAPGDRSTSLPATSP